MSASVEELKHRFNQQTSKIPWQELQKFYARGVVVEVAPGTDLIAAAIAFQRDDKQKVERWLNDGCVIPVADLRALHWLQAEASLWAVVVAPWVLVQEISAESASS